MRHNLSCGFILLAATTIALTFTACSNDDDDTDSTIVVPSGDDGDADNGDAPDFDPIITAYGGEKADDADNDVVGSDDDIYWEANDFDNTVLVTFSGTAATVETSNADILTNVDGAYVTIDLQSNSVKNVEIIATGSSSDGQLKIYGEKKFKLTLNGLDLTSTKGPAINNQCKKRAFVHLADGTTNSLADATTYSADPYYLGSSSESSEDRKGCFFSEGDLIFSGSGVLLVDGNNNHGIATEGYLYVRPGVTIAVTDAANNAIHAKGDSDEGIGIMVTGGLIYANTSATAGKAMKTDLNVTITGGTLMLNTSGGSTFDTEEQDTSSPACIKADGNVVISGGSLTLKSTGAGGKGINTDGVLVINGGTTTVTTTGSKYVYNEAKDLTASPKGVRAVGNVTISGGNLNVSVTGSNDGTEGLESKSKINISNGVVYLYAYDDAMNASTDITISGGKVYCYSTSNDGIDSNGTLTISGGLVIAIGGDAPESGFDCDNSSNFKVNGGTVIGLGGSLQSSPSSASGQRSLVCNGFSATNGKCVCLLNSASSPLLTFKCPRTMSNAVLFISTPDITSGGSYTVSTGGTISGSTDSWNGWYDGGVWSGGTAIGSFTSNSVVSSIGNSSNGGQPNGRH